MPAKELPQDAGMPPLPAKAAPPPEEGIAHELPPERRELYGAAIADAIDVGEAPPLPPGAAWGEEEEERAKAWPCAGACAIACARVPVPVLVPMPVLVPVPVRVRVCQRHNPCIVHSDPQ